MPGELITPNWHVVLIHYPLALLSLGVAIELVTLGRSVEGLRAAGRWMIALGILLAVPAATAGAYAFRDVVVAEGELTVRPWSEVVAESPWNDDQWESVESHAWWTGPGAAAVLLVGVVWWSASDRWRERLYWPGLLLLVASSGVLMVGAWYGAEAVYRHDVVSTAIGAGEAAGESPRDGTSEDAGGESEDVDAAEAAGIPQKAPRTVASLRASLSPLQLHVVAAGFLIAAIAGLGGLTVRSRRQLPGDTDDDQPVSVRQARRWAWFGVAALALITAVFGFWSVWGSSHGDGFAALTRIPPLRLSLHAAVGLLVVLLPIGVASTLRRRGWCGLLPVLLAAAVVVQSWLGVLLLFDGHAGSLLSLGR